MSFDDAYGILDPAKYVVKGQGQDRDDESDDELEKWEDRRMLDDTSRIGRTKGGVIAKDVRVPSRQRPGDLTRRAAQCSQKIDGIKAPGRKLCMRDDTHHMRQSKEKPRGKRSAHVRSKEAGQEEQMARHTVPGSRKRKSTANPSAADASQTSDGGHNLRAEKVIPSKVHGAQISRESASPALKDPHGGNDTPSSRPSGSRQVAKLKEPRLIDDEFSVHTGFSSAVGDLLVEMMTVEEAKVRCRTLPMCEAFTFKGVPTDDAVEIHFVGKGNIVGAGWTTYRWHRAMNSCMTSRPNIAKNSACQGPQRTLKPEKCGSGARSARRAATGCKPSEPSQEARVGFGELPPSDGKLSESQHGLQFQSLRRVSPGERHPIDLD